MAQNEIKNFSMPYIFWQTVSISLQNSECSNWENHVLVEFLPSFSSAILWLKCYFMTETQVLMSFSDLSGVVYLGIISWK